MKSYRLDPVLFYKKVGETFFFHAPHMSMILNMPVIDNIYVSAKKVSNRSTANEENVNNFSSLP